MRVVSRFERDLLRTLYFFLRRLPVEQARPLFINRLERERPACLSRPAVELVQDALAKGCTELLARAGGWKRERFLRDERPVEGRLWERTPPRQLGLTFSPHVLGFLVWVAHVRPEDKTDWRPPPGGLTVGDQVLLYYAYEAMRKLDSGQLLRTRPVFLQHGLCRLAFPEDFAVTPEPPDYALWTTGVGACILESLQGDLAARQVEVERAKGDLTDWQQMRTIGQSQEQALAAFLEFAAAAGRPDLARFVLRAAAAVLVEGVTPRHWVGKLPSAGPRMADRMETHQAALALVRQTDRLRQWERAARRVGYFDEGYARSQLWLADWERWGGDALHQRAQELVQQLDPMKQTAERGSANTTAAPDGARTQEDRS
jgi:hypothetical protein